MEAERVSVSYSSAEWATALLECMESGRNYSVLREEVVLVLVDPRDTFHPLQALLVPAKSEYPSTLSVMPFFAVMRLHPRVTTLMRDLIRDQMGHICHNVMTNLLFTRRTTFKGQLKNSVLAGHRIVHSVSFFSPKAVNLSSGALYTFSNDEMDAKAALSDITTAVHSVSFSTMAAENLLIIIEHGEGYIGQRFQEQQITSIIRIRKSEITNAEQLSLDSVLEVYEEDYREHLEIYGDATTEQPENLKLSVEAGFNLWDVKEDHPSSFLSGASSSSHKSLSMVCLLSSWTGIENIVWLYSKPPPQSTSILCVGAPSRDKLDVSPSALASLSSSQSIHSFPLDVWRTIQLLQNLDQSCSDFTWQWKPNTRSEPQETIDNRTVLQKFHVFLTDADEGLAVAEDQTNNTTELAISLTLDKEELQSKRRSDLDFLEKLWEFFIQNVESAELAVILIQELIASFTTARVFPPVHPYNPTKFASFLRERMDAVRESTGFLDVPHKQQLSHEALSYPKEALTALIELGDWKLHRDVSYWLTQIGFSKVEIDNIMHQFKELQESQEGRGEHRNICLQYLIDICTRGHELGLSVSHLRTLARSCLSLVTIPIDQISQETPMLLLPLNMFIPERIRTNLAEPFFWDLRMSFGHLIQRNLRICEASFHHACHFSLTQSMKHDAQHNADQEFQQDALVLSAETIDFLYQSLPEDILQYPTVLTFLAEVERIQASHQHMDLSDRAMGLMQYECTIRNLAYDL